MPDDNKKSYNYFRATEVFNGKRYYARGKTQREAEKNLAKRLADIKKNGIIDDENMTVKQWADLWLENYVRPLVREPGQKKQRSAMSEAVYKQKKGLIENYIVPEIGSVKLLSVTPLMLQQVLNNDPHKSYSHMSKLKVLLRAMFKQAWLARKMPYDPSANLVLPATENNHRRALTAEEKECFFKAAGVNKHGLMYRFLLATGIRPNELMPLTVGDLDLDGRMVYINKAVEAGSKTVADPKTDAGIRYTIINTLDDKTIIDDMRAHISAKGADDLVFNMPGGKMVSRKAFHRYWESFSYTMDLLMGAEHDNHGHIYDPSDLKADGTPLYPDPNDPKKPRNGHKIAPDLVQYCLRHTFGTDMQRAGVPINITKYMMGHTDIATTANIYIDSSRADALIALNYIDDAVPKSVPNTE